MQFTHQIWWLKDRTQLLSDIKAKLDAITLESPEVRAITGNVGALYLEEKFRRSKRKS